MTIRLAQKIGMRKISAYARKFGIADDLLFTFGDEKQRISVEKNNYSLKSFLFN